MIDLINTIMSVGDKIIRFFPTDQRRLEKYEKLLQHIDYEAGDKLKLYLEECRQKVLFSMSTGMSYNPKNLALFDFVTNNNDLVGLYSARLEMYFELRDSKLCVIESEISKLKLGLYYFYWGAMIVLSFVFACWLPFSNYSQLVYVILSDVILLVVAIVCLLMIGNKQRDMNFIKSFKKRYTR